MASKGSSSSSLDSPLASSPPLRAKMVSFQNNNYSRLGRGSSTINREGLGDLGVDTPPSTLCCPALSLPCHSTTTRIVSRDNGRTNLYYVGTTSKWLSYITDSFTTLINSPWYMIALIFIGTYILSWMFFGGVWLAVSKYESVSNNGSCLIEVDDYSSALLFSIETQVTIGYGNTYITKECTAGLFVLILQCVAGLIVDAILLGLLFTKITRPRNRRRTIMFSDRAVLYESNGEWYLEFRVGNLRKSQIAECHVRLVLYWYRNVNGQMEFEQHDLECGYETGTDRVVLLTPAIVRHKIDDKSPLSSIPSSSIIEEELEVVVVLEGVVEATGLTLQALWSYTAEEIVIAEKLRSIVSRGEGKWIVDFSRFNEIILY